MKFVCDEYNNKIIYPKQELIFNALNKTPLSDVKVVIIGQDPYHTPGFANGLAIYLTPLLIFTSSSSYTACC